jgi:hypothetical protein
LKSNAKVKKLVEQLKGGSISTIYGLSTVVGLSDDKTSVILLEGCVEAYALSLGHFKDQYEKYNQ